jgi:hypothetical protein
VDLSCNVLTFHASSISGLRRRLRLICWPPAETEDANPHMRSCPLAEIMRKASYQIRLFQGLCSRQPVRLLGIRSTRLSEWCLIASAYFPSCVRRSRIVSSCSGLTLSATCQQVRKALLFVQTPLFAELLNDEKTPRRLSLTALVSRPPTSGVNSMAVSSSYCG